MNKASSLTIDGKEYRVYVIYPSLVNSFEIREGDNSGTAQSGQEIRDIIGTAYIYDLQIEPNPKYPEDFDAVFDVLSAPVASHLVSMPYGQGSIEFRAAISSGSRTWYGKEAGYQRWKNMSINYRPLSLQRVVDV